MALLLPEKALAAPHQMVARGDKHFMCRDGRCDFHNKGTLTLARKCCGLKTASGTTPAKEPCLLKSQVMLLCSHDSEDKRLSSPEPRMPSQREQLAPESTGPPRQRGQRGLSSRHGTVAVWPQPVTWGLVHFPASSRLTQLRRHRCWLEALPPVWKPQGSGLRLGPAQAAGGSCQGMVGAASFPSQDFA